MTTTLETTATTVTGERLLRLITAVEPFMGPPEIGLNTVYIEADGQWVSVFATDRSTLAVARDRTDGAWFGPVTMEPGDVDTLRRTLMANPGSQVDFTSATPHHEEPELAVLTAQGSRFVPVIETGARRPPLWRKTLTKNMPTGQGAAAISLRPEYLARLQPAARLAPEQALCWYTPDTPARPVAVCLGEWFHALLMPADLPVPEAAAVTDRLRSGPDDMPF